MRQNNISAGLQTGNPILPYLPGICLEQKCLLKKLD